MALGLGQKTIVAAALVLGVVVGAAWVAGGDSSPGRDGHLVRLDRFDDTVTVLGLDGAIQRTVQLLEGTMEDLVGYFTVDRRRTLVFWNEETKVLSRVDPTTGEIRTLELPTASANSATWQTSAGVLFVHHPSQSIVVDTTSMQVIDLAAVLPSGSGLEATLPFDVAGSALVPTGDQSGMVVFPADSPAEPWFAEGIIVAHSAQGSVAWDPSDNTIRLLTADGQIGSKIALQVDARLVRWSADAFVLVENGEGSLWRLDFAAGEARRVMDLQQVSATLLSEQRLFAVDIGDGSATLYDLEGGVVATFAEGSAAPGTPIEISEEGTACRSITFYDTDAIADRTDTTVIINLETGDVIATLPGVESQHSPDGCSAATFDPDGSYVFHDGRTTEFDGDVDFDPEMKWAVEETDEGDVLVDLSSGARTELPPGDGYYMFLRPTN